MSLPSSPGKRPASFYFLGAFFLDLLTLLLDLLLYHWVLGIAEDGRIDHCRLPGIDLPNWIPVIQGRAK